MSGKSCVFCGASEKLTKEHVFGAWLSRIGLEVSECRFGAGPLNRSARDLGSGRPFDRTVRDVCKTCNSGWMSELEATAHRVLEPLILGQPSSVPKNDRAAIAAWIQKTALVGLCVSSDVERAGGYGLPSEEYRFLYELQLERKVLPQSRYWIGQYSGHQRIASIWVTPVVVRSDRRPEPTSPHAYAVTVVVGKLILHGVRFTSAKHEVGLEAPRGFSELWPSYREGRLPTQGPVDDERFARLTKGLDFVSQVSTKRVLPWGPAVDLERSTLDGSRVRLPTPCGRHHVYYPLELAAAGASGVLLTFMTSCECGMAYLVETERDGAYFRSEGTPRLCRQHTKV